MRSPSLDSICQRLLIEPGVAPGASVAVAFRNNSTWSIATGAAGIRSSLRPTVVDPTTLYDLASVTKPIVASALARSIAAGVLSWDSPLGDWVKEAKGTPSEHVTLELLASHRAGLAAHQRLFEPLTRGRPVDRSDLLRQAARARRPECVGPPGSEGFADVYSDLGYLLLGEALARAESSALDSVIWKYVTRPLSLDLGSAREWATRGKSRLKSVAPTETVEYRGGEIVGKTHDDNAWAFAGDGLAGHAGLFGTAKAVALFGARFLDALSGREATWLDSEQARVLVRPRPGGSLRAGFDGKSAAGSSSGERFGPHAFGHLGFTGTSLWCDPDTDIVVAVLTNRVCPSRDHILIRAVRPVLHDALHAEAETSTQ